MPHGGIESTSLGYVAMQEHWPLIEDLKGGTLAMRAAGELWLPREPAELSENYNLRLGRSVLYNAYADTVKRLIAKPFSRAAQILGDGLPKQLETIEFDMDGFGTSLTELGAEIFGAGLDYGLTHCLVDFPAFTESASLAEERELGIRARFIHIKPPNLLAWRYDDRELVEIRIREWKVERDGFEEFQQEYIRVVTPNDWALYKRVEKAYLEESSGANTLGYVPLITFYTGKVGLLEGRSPLEDLAWLNLAHWQSLSDQRNILRFVRAGILVAKGFPKDDLPKIVISPNMFIRTTSKDASISYTEHTGKGIEAGAKDLQELEERMEVMGLAPFMERSANSTATGKIINESKTTTDIQTWIRRLELFFGVGLKIAAEWSKVELPEDIAIDIFNDFGITQLQQTEVANLITMRKNKEISHETFLLELKRRTFLSDALDVEKEMIKVAADQPEILPPISENISDDDDNDT